MTLVQPAFIPQPWANSGSREDIPNTSAAEGRATWKKGFPQENALPLEEGGVPPHWLDIQGVLYALSNHICFMQTGGRYLWDQTKDYAAGACIIGSDYKVYQALQESGPGTSAGKKNPTSASNSAYWSELAGPDGTTIQVVDGKLTVSLTNIASEVADGKTITASSGKLSVNLTNSTAADRQKIAQYLLLADSGLVMDNSEGQIAINLNGVSSTRLKKISQYLLLANGGLAMDSTEGQIAVNLSSTYADATRLKKISQYLAHTNGGLVMDNTSGQLKVDWTKIPDDIFEEHLKKIKIQIPLTANLQLYVDGNTGAGSDTIVDGRGTQALPFATIQACVRYATQTYALGSHNIYINVAPISNSGAYSEQLTLPTFTRTSGRIIIRPETSSSGTVQILSTDEDNPVVQCEGGQWVLRKLTISGQYTKPTDGKYHRAGAVLATGNTTMLEIQGCALALNYSGGTPDGDGKFFGYLASAETAAIINFDPFEGAQTSLDCQLGNALGSTLGAYALYAERNAHIYFPTDNFAETAANEYTIPCSGEVTAFARPSNGSSIESYGVGIKQQFSGTVTGSHYAITTGSCAIAPTGGFPGDANGSLDSSTYCWYTTHS